MTIKKNDVLVANKAFSVGDAHFDKGHVFLVEKGGKNQEIITLDKQGFFIGFEGDFDTDEFKKKTIADVSQCEKDFGTIQIKNIKRFATYDGYSMFADLFVDGKKAGVIENDGWGSGSFLREEAGSGMSAKLSEAAKQVLIKNGMDSDHKRIKMIGIYLWDYFAEQYYVFESFKEYMCSFEKQVA